MMWDVCAKKCKAMGVEIRMNEAVTGIGLNDGSWSIHTSQGNTIDGFDYVLSSTAIAQLVPHISPAVPAAAKEAAARLKYRDFITVVLILKDQNKFDDNWIYIHDPSVKVGRVQNLNPGALIWFRIPQWLVMVWNIFVLKVTACGPQMIAN
jgi:protoporphyrinogen oxidase